MDPKGPLVLSSSATKMVNDEVLKEQKTASSSSSSPIESISNKHLTLTPAQHFEVGKRAAEHGVTAVLKTACKNTST